MNKSKNSKTHDTSCIHHFCQADSDDSDASIHQQSIRSSGGTPTTASAAKKPTTTRSASTDSSTSTDSSASSNAAVRPSSTTVSAATKQTTKPEVPASTVRSRGTTETVPEKKPFQSRFLPNHQTPASTSVEKKDESGSSSEEETTSEEETEEEEEEVEVENKKNSTTAKDTALKTDIGALLNRSTNARDAYADTRRTSRDETTNSRTGHSSPTYGRSFEESKYPTTRSRTTAQHTDDDHNSSRYGSSSTG